MTVGIAEGGTRGEVVDGGAVGIAVGTTVPMAVGAAEVGATVGWLVGAKLPASSSPA